MMLSKFNKYKKWSMKAKVFGFLNISIYLNNSIESKIN